MHPMCMQGLVIYIWLHVSRSQAELILLMARTALLSQLLWSATATCLWHYPAAEYVPEIVLKGVM